MSALRELLQGWLIIAITIVTIWQVDRLHARWERRQHQRNLGRIPPRRTW